MNYKIVFTQNEFNKQFNTKQNEKTYVKKIVYIGLFVLLFIIISLFMTPKSNAAELTGTFSSGTKTYTVGNNGTYTEVGEAGFTVSGGNLTLESVSPFFTIRGPITITGGTLTIKFSSSFSGSGSIIKREVESSLKNSAGYIPYNASSSSKEQFSDSMFVVKGGTLNIQGTSDRMMTISGAGQFTANNSSGSCTFPATSDTSDDVEAKGAIISVNGNGNINLKYTTLTSNYNNVGSGGALVVSDGSSNITLDNCTITKCYSVASGGAIYIATTGGKVTINNSTIKENFTAAKKETTGGTIRCTGVNMCGLEINNSTISNNYSMRASGGIAWNAMRIEPLVVNNCVIDGNISNEGAGGISCQSLMRITGNTKITNNKSLEGNGGGISISTWGSQNPVSNFELTQDGNVELGPKVVITNNYAKLDGGGIHFKVGTIKTNLLDSSATVVFNTKNDGSPYSMSLVINGATVKNNTSDQNGGGIGMLKESTSPYIMQIQMNSGEISQNKNLNNGGAAYLSGTGADFIMNGGKITSHTQSQNGSAVYTNGGSFIMNDGIIEKNETLNNGNIYVKSGKFEITNGFISNNKSSNGGGVYVSGGNASIKGGTIDNCIADNGGAVYLSGGNVDLKGGVINNCISSNGGAIYVSGGNVNLEEGTIKNCQANNGGGIYITNGNLTMDGGEIVNNQSNEYGGGIYANSDLKDLTVLISSGNIEGNISGKNGGGLAVNMGNSLKANITIGLERCKGLDNSHIHPIIQNNTANENGGGFWLNGDSIVMDMYCGSIYKNLAVVEPGSANIYQTGGTATVYAGEVGDGVIVIGGKYDYIPENQISEITITYNSNIPGNIEEKDALVTIGVGIFLPKTLFTRDGYELVGWAHVPNPTQTDTIYTVGEPYLIGEEDITVYAVWLLEGKGTVLEPIVNVGKIYDSIVGGKNIILSSNASFTVQMEVADIQPNYYTNRQLTFDKYLPVGTNITMIDFCDSNNKKYYSYQIKSENIKIIPLENFIKNGSEEKYINSLSEDKLNEKFLFIVELPIDNYKNDAIQMTLIRNSADATIASIKQDVTFTTTDARISKLEYKKENLNPSLENTIKILYTNKNAAATDTRFENKKAALIIKNINNIFPEDTSIFDGTKTYLQSGKNIFVIPLGNIDENKEISFKLISETLIQNEIGANLKVELFATDDLENPCMGEKITEIENIEISPIRLSAIKTDLPKRFYNQNEFSREMKIEYETIKFEDSLATLEVQKKNENGTYETQNNILNQVDGISENINGVFDLELNSRGEIDLEFVNGFENQKGTYRILLKVSDLNGKEIEVPCNFIVIE